MALMRINDYRERYFHRPPTPATVRRWIDGGELYGIQFTPGGVWWVDPRRDPADMWNEDEAAKAQAEAMAGG